MQVTFTCAAQPTECCSPVLVYGQSPHANPTPPSAPDDTPAGCRLAQASSSTLQSFIGPTCSAQCSFCMKHPIETTNGIIEQTQRWAAHNRGGLLPDLELHGSIYWASTLFSIIGQIRKPPSARQMRPLRMESLNHALHLQNMQAQDACVRRPPCQCQ
jgi:hypothetical protein